ncbi:MAG TPA: hypothetical protein VLT33_39250, partial [Labilithrix sp.]|nr:hypothetical protein [Labilithrix sp.]
MAFLSAYLVFLVAMNVFLSTSLFGRALNGDPDTIFITFERGWSLWPGRVHARNLLIRSSDRGVQFVLRIERCDFTFAPLDLAREKTFHVTRVAGSGITFQARQRLPSPSATPEVVASLPTIPGFERIPLPVPGPPDLLERWDDAHWHLWSVRLENVVADDIREVWIDGMRWTGEAHITGGFYLKPIRQAQVDDIHLTLRESRPGKVTVLQHVVVEPLAGTVDLNIAAFDPRTVALRELLHHVTLRTDVRGRVPDLAGWPASFTAPLALAGAAELRQVAVRVAAGKLVSGSHVDLAVPNASVDVAGHRGTGALSFVADTVEDAGAKLTFRLQARALAAARQAEVEAIVRAPLLEIAGDARALDLGEPLGDLHVTASLPAGELPDLRLVQPELPESTRRALSLDGGRVHASVKGELWYADRRARAEATLEAEGVDLRA